jgi:hypothetical protein
LNPGHFNEFRKFIKISPVGITNSGRIASNKLMAKHTSLLTKNTAFEHSAFEHSAFEHKFHVDMRKWQKLQNGGQIPFPVAKNYFIWSKTTGFRRKY